MDSNFSDATFRTKKQFNSPANRYIFGFGHNAFGQLECSSDGVNGYTKELISNEREVIDLPVGIQIHSGEETSKIEGSWTSTFFLRKGGTISVLGCIPNTDVMGYKENLFPDKACLDVSCGWDKAAFITDEGDCLIWEDYARKDSKPALVNAKQKFSTVTTGDLQTIANTGDGQVGTVVSSSCKNEEQADLLFQPVLILVSVQSVSCGKEHILLQTSNGQVFSYGGGSRGQLGHGTPDGLHVPRALEALAGISIIQISTGGWHSAVVSDSGDLYIWGWNESGQVGVSDTIDSDGNSSDGSQVTIQCQMVPVPLLFDVTDEDRIVSVGCGARHTAAVSSDGQVWTWGWGMLWGWGRCGQLGHGNRENRVKPTQVKFFPTLNSSKVAASVHCGHWTTFVIMKNR